MKLKTNKKSLLKIVLPIAGILLIAFAVFLFVSLQHTQNNNSAPTKEQVENGNSIKESTVNPPESTDSSSKNEDPVAPNDNKISAIIPYADSKRLTVLIEEIVSDGTCTLVISGAGDSKTYTVPTQSGPSSSTCEGFNYPELTPGEWSASVTIKSPSGSTAIEKKIEVN